MINASSLKHSQNTYFHSNYLIVSHISTNLMAREKTEILIQTNQSMNRHYKNVFLKFLFILYQQHDIYVNIFLLLIATNVKLIKIICTI